MESLEEEDDERFVKLFSFDNERLTLNITGSRSNSRNTLPMALVRKILKKFTPKPTLQSAKVPSSSLPKRPRTGRPSPSSTRSTSSLSKSAGLALPRRSRRSRLVASTTRRPRTTSRCIPFTIHYLHCPQNVVDVLSYALRIYGHAFLDVTQVLSLSFQGNK